MAQLTPNELSEREFTKSIRGYNPVEVDEYIAKITESYTALYRENMALTKKLAEAEARLANATAEEESIKKTLETARKASDAVMEEAYEKADRVLLSVKTGCEAILGEFREKIEIHQKMLADLKRIVNSFKNELFDTYREHIELVDKLAPDAVSEPEFSSDEYISHIVADMKYEMAGGEIAMETIRAEEYLKSE